MLPRTLKIISIFKHFESNLINTVTISKYLFSTCSCVINTSIRNRPFAKHLAIHNKSNFQKGSNINKETIISSLKFKSDEDAKPFYMLPMTTLYQIQKTTFNDLRNGYCENRLYYISSRIQCSPTELSERLTKRTFVYRLSFQWLESSLNELLDKGVSGNRILRDLWVLKYHPKTVGERLQRIKEMGIENLFPWMVRCTPDILNKYLKNTQETISILGDTKSTQTYLASRLDISVNEVKAIYVKIPTLKTIRAAKLKQFLDFLINEGFEPKEIAKKPRILASSSKTVQKRLEELQQLGVMNINLNLLCRSKKDYKKVVDAIKSGLEDSNKT